jgi:GNAT superfamily N-acetyltransferase
MDGFGTREPEGGVRTHSRPGPRRAGRSVALRQARAGELDEIASLFAPALQPYRGSGADWILDAYLAELEDGRRRFEEAEVVVAEHDGRIVGTIAFYADVRLEGWSNLPGGWAGFRALAVHPCMRGGGIGEALVRGCVERSRDVGAATLGIHTISLLTDAVRLYERLGFVRCPEFDLRAADIFPSEHADETVGLAFRLDLARSLESRR